MLSSHTKWQWIVGILLLAGTLSWSSFFREYFQTDTVNVHVFPKEFPGWAATEIKISDNDYAILETRNAFTRIYTSVENEKVMLFIVYSQNNRKVSHPPEICYTGSGATIVGRSIMRFKVGRGGVDFNRLVIEQKTDKEMLYFTFKIGTTFTPNYWKQQILIALKTILGKPASSALIRISIPANDRDPEAVDLVAQKFLQQVMPAIQQYLR